MATALWKILFPVKVFAPDSIKIPTELASSIVFAEKVADPPVLIPTGALTMFAATEPACA
jgi:hypothetical protein